MTKQIDLEQAIKRGFKLARDPQNALIRDPHTPRTTTIYSEWYRDVCPICHHTFREDDLVLPHPDPPASRSSRRRRITMVHEDHRSALCCWSALHGHIADQVITPETHTQMRAAFLDGLHTHWHPDENLQTVVVAAGSRFVRLDCPICRHTVRAGDTVVLCPCGRCGGVFHQDITRHLTCWDTWSLSGHRTYCAFTGVAVPTVEEVRRG
jgi:hypothetical protein